MLEGTVSLAHKFLPRTQLRSLFVFTGVQIAGIAESQKLKIYSGARIKYGAGHYNDKGQVYVYDTCYDR
jgi:hypothetical protein